jgi:hypothetical protein
MKECEEKEDAGEFKDDGDDRSIEDRRKDRRECLDMLKHELDRIRNGGNPYDFDCLLGEDEKKLMKELNEDLTKDDGEEEEEEEEEDDDDDEKGIAKDEIDRSNDEASVDPEPKKDK